MEGPERAFTYWPGTLKPEAMPAPTSREISLSPSAASLLAVTCASARRMSDGGCPPPHIRLLRLCGMIKPYLASTELVGLHLELDQDVPGPRLAFGRCDGDRYTASRETSPEARHSRSGCCLHPHAGRRSECSEGASVVHKSSRKKDGHCRHSHLVPVLSSSITPCPHDRTFT